MQYRKMHLALLFVVIVFYGCEPDSGTVVGADDNPESNANIYNYSLKDINSSSSTYGENIGPDYFQGQINLHYFGHQY